MVDVLIAGAGPTGLALAAQILACGGTVRILERRVRPRPDSPALVVQPRTLEVLQPLGVTEALVERGSPAGNVVLHSGGRRVVLAFPAPSMPDTAFPNLLMVPQWEVEQVLEEHLTAKGIAVEHGTELVSYAATAKGVECVAVNADGECERMAATYLVGCDGADSVVRRLAGIPFPVSAYPASAVLADLKAGESLPHDAMHVFVERSGILFLFPLPEPRRWRLLVARNLHRPGGVAPAPLGFGDLAEAVQGFPVQSLGLETPDWLKEVPLRRGQARLYRSGNVLLAGDAAHVHSPAGGQGMNTGIQDAVNLGWKLAMVARGAARPELLDSYHAERWPVAKWTRRATDPAFAAETSDHLLVSFVRKQASRTLSPLARWEAPTRAGLRIIGGLETGYRRSPAIDRLGRWKAAGLKAGDRFPNAQLDDPGAGRWLHHLLQPGVFNLVLCGPQGAWEKDALARLRARYSGLLHVHLLGADPFPGPHRSSPEPDRSAAPVQYLVRPDGYLALVAGRSDLAALEAYLERWFPAPVAPPAVPRPDQEAQNDVASSA